jgi:hypothetical protein
MLAELICGILTEKRLIRPAKARTIGRFFCTDPFCAARDLFYIFFYIFYQIALTVELVEQTILNQKCVEAHRLMGRRLGCCFCDLRCNESAARKCRSCGRPCVAR